MVKHCVVLISSYNSVVSVSILLNVISFNVPILVLNAILIKITVLWVVSFLFLIYHSSRIDKKVMKRIN